MKTKRILAACMIAAATVAGCHDQRTTASGQSGATTLTSAEAPFAAPAMTGTPDVATLVAKVSPSVVNITATQELRLPKGMLDPFEFFFGPRGERGAEGDETVKRRGLGSGFILDSAGHIVTNAHVVEKASTVRVTLSDEREFDAKVKGRDKRLDLAVLELQGAKDLPPHVVLGQSEALRVGDYVVVIGNPFGLGNTVTTGIVSAKGRALGAGPYDDFIQTDASINPGNSGGPLFNVKGEVVGISTAMNPAGQGIGFAIPIDALNDVLPQLMEKGFVSRGKLGIMIQSVDPGLAKALNLDKPRGAIVAEVEPGSAAAKAGIKSGELITAVDASPVQHAHELPRLIARQAPGSKVKLQVLGKSGASRTVEVTLDELREADADEKKRGEKSFGAAPSPSGLASEFGLELADDPKGIVVRSVDPGSTGAEAIQPGDVVLEINGVPAKSARDAATRMRQTGAGRPLLLKVERNGHALFVAIERK